MKVSEKQFEQAKKGYRIVPASSNVDHEMRLRYAIEAIQPESVSGDLVEQISKIIIDGHEHNLSVQQVSEMALAVVEQKVRAILEDEFHAGVADRVIARVLKPKEKTPDSPYDSILDAALKESPSDAIGVKLYTSEGTLLAEKEKTPEDRVKIQPSEENLYVLLDGVVQFSFKKFEREDAERYRRGVIAELKREAKR